MEILKNVTIKLSQKDLEEMIKDYVQNKGYVVNSYRWLSGSRLEGYGMNEHETNYFDGVHVEAVNTEDL